MSFLDPRRILPTPLAAAVVVALGLAGCNSGSSNNDSDNSQTSPTTPSPVVTIDKPVKPTGLGFQQEVATPDVIYPLPSLQYAPNNADGTLRWIIEDNPIAYLLRGMNDIWQGTSSDYQSAASGDGPDTYVAAPIMDAEAWQANIKYVVDVTNERTDDEAILAFLDDTRAKVYSVIDGFGPLTETYVNTAGAYTTIPAPTVDQVLTDQNYLPIFNDAIFYAGSKDSPLGEMVTLVEAFRQGSPASTNASKYIYSSPRPWRINDNGDVDFLGNIKDYRCEDANGNVNLRTIDTYATSVKVVPGLVCAQREHSSGDYIKGLYTPDGDNRRKDGGYPSGHTNAAYLSAMAYAYALPQRYSEMLARSAQLGESRIQSGMHSPVDVIGGRIHSQIIAAYALNQPSIQAEATAAYNQAQEFFGQLAAQEGMSLYEYAHRPVAQEAGLVNGSLVNVEVYDNNLYDDYETNRELYRFRMTYGLPQDTTKAGLDPIVPEGAEALLASRQPYLSDSQRRAVLYTTSVDSGYKLLDKTNGWGRLDLLSASYGYGAFLGDVVVEMNASEGGFNEWDQWRNDISGDGMLVKAGTGHLALSGENSYAGGTILRAGTLEAKSPAAFGTGDLYVEGGTVLIDAEGAVKIEGNATLESGTLSLVMDKDSSQFAVSDTLFIEGGSLVLDFSNLEVRSGDAFVLASGGALTGTFDSVDAGDRNVEVTYSDSQVRAVIQ